MKAVRTLVLFVILPIVGLIWVFVSSEISKKEVLESVEATEARLRSLRWQSDVKKGKISPLVSCVCGREISVRATVCPHCGDPRSQN
jgi:ribosomal protein L37E